MYRRFILLHSAMHKYLWSSTLWTWPSTTLLKHPELSHGKEIFEIYFGWPTGKIRDWGINKSFQVFRLRSPTFWITRYLSTAISEGKGSWKGHVEAIGSFFLQSNHHGRHRDVTGESFQALLFVASTTAGFLKSWSCGMNLPALLYRKLSTPALNNPYGPKFVRQWLQRRCRHLGFGKFNLQNFWWTSRIITGWYSQAGKEAKAKANGEVAGRLDPKLLYQFVLEMSWKGVSENGKTGGWKSDAKDAWMALALLQRWAPLQPAHQSQCVDPAGKSKNPWWFWRILWDFW